MINVKDLYKEFNQDGESIKILKGITTEFKKGERVAIIGPSGSGKSTFLRCLNLLEKPTSGKIEFEGHDITSPKCDINKIRQSIGMVFQHFNLFPHLTVLKNITLAPTTLKILSTQEAETNAISLLERVGLKNKANFYPSRLSGGQKQRIAIIRAMLMNPKLMLFDEPTSALDPEMIKEVVSVIKNIASKGMTMILVTHEMSFVKDLATRVLFMDDGKIIADETPFELFENSQNERINRFLNKLK